MVVVNEIKNELNNLKTKLMQTEIFNDIIP